MSATRNRKMRQPYAANRTGYGVAAASLSEEAADAARRVRSTARSTRLTPAAPNPSSLNSNKGHRVNGDRDGLPP